MDGQWRTPVGTDGNGNPIYERPLPQGFFLVVEAKVGPSRAKVGSLVFNWDDSDPNVLPDLQIQPSRILGTGTTAVCDRGPVPLPIGGVPAFPTPGFPLTQQFADIANDFGCRFGYPSPESPTGLRTAGEACTGSAGDFFYVDSSSTAQFCGLIGSELAFPSGDTLITVRVRDVGRRPGPPRSIVIRVP